MRVAVLFAITLALAGCEHMYGGFDSGRFVQIAERHAEDRGMRLQGLTPSVGRSDGQWLVRFDPEPCETCVGGGMVFFIDRAGQRVSRVLIEQ